jgi:hypothetical protein
VKKMSDAHYGEAIELIRYGSHHDGVSLSYFQCRDLLCVIEEGLSSTLTAQELGDMQSAEINRLRFRLREEEEGILAMGEELDRAERVERLCNLFREKLLKWGVDLEEFVSEYGMEDELDALDKVGGWGDKKVQDNEPNVMLAVVSKDGRPR